MHRNRVASLALAAFLLLSVAAGARNNPEKTSTVDSGAFGLYVHGKRIATETFQIRQGMTVSTATSEFRLDDHESKTTQRTELQIAATGDLRRYEWRESPGKAQIVVEPANDFLIEHITPNPPERPVEHPFILPASTMVLDDFAFSQREILVWRYLAQACPGDLRTCRPARAQFGVLVPQQHTSSLVTIAYAGPEKTSVRGVERELNRLNMKVDDLEWIIYVDDNLKVVRMLIPSEQTEILRDAEPGR